MKRDWLVQIREDEKITQECVAKMVKISRPFYAQIEIGERRPSPEVAQRLAIKLNFVNHGLSWTRFYENEETREPTG